MGSILTGLLVRIASLIGGGIGGSISAVTKLIHGGAKQLMSFHEEGIAFARDMGMSLNQAQAYTRTLTENTASLAKQYGVTAQQIKAIQRGISEATGRQLMLNKSQTEGFLAMNKLVGEQTVSKFQEELMNGMGGQINTVQNAISKAYITASKNGLGAKKLSSDIANNLSMMNKLSFRNGVDGLTKMAVQAQKVGLSLSQVERVAEKFMDFEGAIQSSAQLQMLGGAAGAIGGNPLDMMYEANYDPEALQDRMIKMMSGYAQFDSKTGMSRINGFGMDMVRNIAKAMGMDEGEAVKLAKKNAEIKYKEQKLGGLNGYNETQKNAILNKSYVENGRVYVNTGEKDEFGNDKRVDITGGNVPRELLDMISKYEGMDEIDIMKDQAQSLTTINEKISGFVESAWAEMAKKLEPFLPKVQEIVIKLGNKLIEFAPVVADGVKSIADKAVGAYKWMQDFLKEHKGLVELLKNSLNFIKNHMEGVLTTLLAIKAAKWLGGLGGGSGGGLLGKVGGKAASGIGKGVSNIASRLHNESPHDWFSQSYKWSRNAANPNQVGKFRAFGTAIKDSWQGASKLAKGTALLGIGASAMEGFGAWNAHAEEAERIKNSNMSDEEKKNALEQNRIDRNTEVGGAVGQGVGSVLGTFFFGPLGGMIGGAVGKFAGEFIGKYWDPIVDTLGKFGNALLKGGKALLDGTVSALKWLLDNNPIAWMAKGVGKLFGKDWSPTKLIGNLFGGEGHAAGGIVGTKDNVVGVAKGEIILSKTMQENLVSILKNPKISAKPVGQNDFTYKPGNTEISKVGDSTITVKDFNINLGGTIRLDAGSNSANINMNELMRDPVFMNKIKGIIEESVSKSYYGGRRMNDLASKRGMFVQSGTIGRRS